MIDFFFPHYLFRASSATPLGFRILMIVAKEISSIRQDRGLPLLMPPASIPAD